jgi:hypothetical protein
LWEKIREARLVVGGDWTRELRSMKWLGVIASLLIVGVAVLWMYYPKQPELAAQHELSIGCRGEAIALDLGSRGTLFALLTQGTDDRSGCRWIVLRAFGFDGGSLPRPVEEGVKQVSRLSGKRELPLDSLPRLVRFIDLTNPRTVEGVSPLDIGERFGTNVKLVRATLEIVPAGIWPFNSLGITGEPITTGVEKRLSWLTKYYDTQLDGQQFESISASLRLANSLSSGAFKAP